MSERVVQDRSSALGTSKRTGCEHQTSPVTSFFIFAFLGTWTLFVPILLSSRGLGLINIPDGLGFALFILSTYPDRSWARGL